MELVEFAIPLNVKFNLNSQISNFNFKKLKTKIVKPNFIQVHLPSATNQPSATTNAYAKNHQAQI